MMWDRVDTMLERAPHAEALRLHRVELLEVDRRRRAGLDLGPLAADHTMAIADELAAIPLLARVREAYDGQLVLFKGAEVALDYPAPRLRRFCDLDLIADDAERAQAALIAAGFEEVDDPEVYRDIHHLRPLWWPGLPLVVELHMRANWPTGIPGPSTEELLAAAVPSRVGVAGIDTLPPAHHTLALAAHAWSHQPLGRLGNLIDVAVMLERSDPAEVDALARRWGCTRMWRTTRAAIGSVLGGDRRSAGVALWARHLRGVRERTVFEWHVKDVMAPTWGLPKRRVPGALRRELLATGGLEGTETWRAKVSRAVLAVRNAGRARSEHDLALAARGAGSMEAKEAG
jgi:hypothetical protein